MSLIHCPWCEQDHGDLLLCKPAKQILDAIYAQGSQFKMPTIEFDAPVPGAAAMFGEGTVLLSQLVVKAAIVPVAGVPRPTLIFTGLDGEHGTLPSWIYPGSPADIREAVQLVADTADMAIRAAERERKAS